MTQSGAPLPSGRGSVVASVNAATHRPDLSATHRIRARQSVLVDLLVHVLVDVLVHVLVDVDGFSKRRVAQNLPNLSKRSRNSQFPSQHEKLFLQHRIYRNAM